MISLKDRVLFITGASRGIGKAIAMRAAQDGARIAVVAKTAEPHPKLTGTVYSAVEDINKTGGKGLACIADIRFEEQVQKAVDATIREFGGIDILVNDASAISLTPTLDTTVKKFDKNAPSPKFKGDWKQKIAKYNNGLFIIRSDQCPYTVKNVKEIAKSAEKILNLCAKIINLKTFKSIIRCQSKN